jgi:hypothetical protein
MNDATREQLRIILAVALGVVPRRLKRDLAERIIAKSEPARAEIVARLVTELDRHFEIEVKPSEPAGPGPHSVWQAMPPRK